MCGHFGVITKAKNGFSTREVEFFSFLGYLDTTRGEDATSFTLVTNNGDVEILKEASVFHTFIQNKEIPFLSAKAISRGQALLGHNRKATVGDKADDNNAHPFVINNRYVFNHNGKLYNHQTYMKDVEVDSEVLGNLLCPLGSDVNKLEAKLSEITAAYTCVWYDLVEHKVYVVRNAERPFYYATNRVGDIFYASEKWMLLSLSEKFDLSLTYNLLPVNTLLTIDLAEGCLTTTTESLSVKKVSPVHTHIPTPGSKGSGSGDNKKPTITKEAALSGLEALFKSLELSKSRFKRTSKTILQGPLSVWVEEVMSDGVPGDKTQLVFGTNPNYPGWSFQFHVYGKTQQEAFHLLDGNYINGYVKEVKYDKATATGIAIMKPDWKLYNSEGFLHGKTINAHSITH